MTSGVLLFYLGTGLGDSFTVEMAAGWTRLLAALVGIVDIEIRAIELSSNTNT